LGAGGPRFESGRPDQFMFFVSCRLCAVLLSGIIAYKLTTNRSLESPLRRELCLESES